MSCTKH